MSGIDVSVRLALLLSLASAILCVAYGVVRWNADDDEAQGSPARGAPWQDPAATPPEGDGG